MEKASTARSKSYFRAVEHSDGAPWIICEPQGPQIPALSNGFIGFDLRPGTSLREAEALADMLRRMVTDVSVTTFEEPAVR